MVFQRLLRPRTLVDTPWLSSRLVIVWGLFLASLGIGILIGQSTGLADEADGVRDLLALLFVAGLSILLSAIRASDAVLSKVVFTYIVTVTISLAALLVLAALRATPLIDPWYQAIRFRGWSENPNQLALMLLALPFFCVWAYQRTESGSRRLWIAACLGISLIAGALSLSEALYLAWGASFGLCFLAWFASYYRSPARSPLSAMWRNVTLPSVLIGVCIAVVVPLVVRAVEIAAAIYAIGNQGSTRLAVWRHGFEAALYSPLFGLGPGAYSGTTGPFQGSEAHSTFIDVLSQAGLLGLTAYLMLLIFVGRRLVASRELAFVGAFSALVIFSCFHYVLRQPIFWLSLILMVRLAPAYYSVAPRLQRRTA
ncbi:MAG TPA: O-antigen ligase family protein [Gammaproteobacteria bacterium]